MKKVATSVVLKDSNGKVNFYFAIDIGHCSNVIAELWAIMLGIHIVWSRGFKQFMVEYNSSVAILLLNHGCPSFHLCSSMVSNIKAFKEQGGSFVCLHSLRKGNQVTDKLANFGLDLDR